MQRIKLNVGGRTFETTRLTVEKSKWFSAALKDGDTELFIDRNPDLFEVVLEYLRTNNLTFPPTVNKKALKMEFSYFGLDVIIQDCNLWDSDDCFLCSDKIVAIHTHFEDGQYFIRVLLEGGGEFNDYSTKSKEDARIRAKFLCNRLKQKCI